MWFMLVPLYLCVRGEFLGLLLCCLVCFVGLNLRVASLDLSCFVGDYCLFMILFCGCCLRLSFA